jgi:hypothetical protein
MTKLSNAETAERLSRRRARMLPALAGLIITQQAAYFFGQTGRVDRWVDWVGLGSWALLSVVILMAIVTGGFWLKSAEVRALLDDEGTKASRADAARIGFTLAMLAAIGLHVLSAFDEVETREALQLVISVGLVAALVRFAFLERRAHRYG